ncbi:nucleoid-associated protein [Acinetobacter bereziniae]|uniref:Nucleoid-associated protein n=1 Tax=Acinetobacter bereziniae TaxID=106648 RepID=A0A8I1AJ50_ACIBZ|nr:nucleoid-associated protein [Acinetobacter bereziniae]QQC84999.1 nucleoid-associated protein [Acinetobacter bereziniae]UUN98151.1 nucleoid-associated protein [Acinetobacter bereziniae]
MQLTHLIIHEIEKESKQKKPSDFAPHLVLDATQELPIDKPASEKLADDMRKKYTESISGYGNIDRSDNSIFQLQLDQYRKGELDFVQLTRLLVGRLMSELSEGKPLDLGTGGLIVCLEYIEANKTFLLITIIKEKKSITFNRDDFDLEEFLSVDLQNLHEGARIDLEKWEANIQPFISFIKKSRVSEYFRTSINCVDFTDSKTYTESTKKAIKDYLDSKEEWSDEVVEEKQEIFKNYFMEAVASKKSADGKPVVKIKELSALLDPENANDFYEFVREKEYEISDEFQPDRATVGRWTRKRVKVGTINLTFDVSDFEDGNIVSTDNGDILIVGGAKSLENQMKS